MDCWCVLVSSHGVSVMNDFYSRYVYVKITTAFIGRDKGSVCPHIESAASAVGKVHSKQDHERYWDVSHLLEYMCLQS